MKIIPRIILVVLALSVVASYFSSWKLEIDRNFLANLIVFQSIFFGFSITGLSIISTSSFVSRLYDHVDPDDSSITLLHRLVHKFKESLYFSLLSLLYYYFLDLYLFNIQDGLILHTGLIKMTPFLGVLVLNVYFAFSILETLSMVIIQEGKIKK